MRNYEEMSEPRNGPRIGHQILVAPIPATNDKPKIVEHNALTSKFEYKIPEMRHFDGKMYPAFRPER